MMTYLRKSALIVSLAFIGLLSFAGFALAAGAAAPSTTDGSLLDLAKPVYDAFMGGHYAYGAALLVVLMVALAKKYLGDKIPWLHSDAGGSLLALLAAMSAAVAAGLATPGASITLALLKSSLLVGIGAAGGYAMLKNLIIEPLLKPLAAKAPAWMQPLFQLIFWIFDKPSPTETANAAGDAAVIATPGSGVDGVIGASTDVK